MKRSDLRDPNALAPLSYRSLVPADSAPYEEIGYATYMHFLPLPYKKNPLSGGTRLAKDPRRAATKINAATNAATSFSPPRLGLSSARAQQMQYALALCTVKTILLAKIK
jgi:hypothetical protein